LPVDESLRFVVTEVYEFLLEHKLFWGSHSVCSLSRQSPDYSANETMAVSFQILYDSFFLRFPSRYIFWATNSAVK
jgi:hypothetical protein